jgi:hypothetical protein
MLENPNSRARERAIRALEEITLRPYGANIEKWKKWYDEFFRIGG